MSDASPVTVDCAERLPAEALRAYVARYGGYRLRGVEAGETRALPSRHVTLMIGLSGPFRLRDVGVFDSLVGGLHDKPALVEREATMEGLHLCLKPLGVRALFGMPARALAGTVVSLADIASGIAGELQARLGATASWATRFDVLDELLLRIVRPRPVARALEHGLRRLVSDAGATRIDALASALGWSRRHLSETFVEELGVTPKTFARILRFEQACALIKFRRPPLAEVAAACGYYDQPHMTREWLSLAGCTPRAWIREELPFLQDYELAAADSLG